MRPKSEREKGGRNLKGRGVPTSNPGGFTGDIKENQSSDAFQEQPNRRRKVVGEIAGLAEEGG